MLILFKAGLLVCLVVLGYLALFQIRRRLFHRVLGLLLAGVLAAFIISPQLSTEISSLLGIGRGVDLIFYLSHLLGAYLAIRIFQRQMRLEEQLTRLVRS